VLTFAVALVISLAVNLISVAVGVAGSAAVGAGRHRIPDPAAVPFFVGFSLIGIVLHLVSVVVNTLVSSFFTCGMANFSIKVARGAPYSFGDLFAGGPFFLSVVVANFLISFAVGLGLLLLIVPGIIVGIGFSMALPLIVDRNLGPIDALTESWKLTEGNRVNIFIFGLIAFGLAIAGMCACGLGLLLVAPVGWIAYLYIYLRLTGQPVAPAGRAV
jgi:uncharacterized membrane protein